MNQGPKSPSAFINESYIEIKIDTVTEGLGAQFANLIRKASKDNKVSIIDFLSSMKQEINISHRHKENFIRVLHKLSKFCQDRPFKEITRDDIISFLDGLRKLETDDPLHKWIGTYNLYRNLLLRFFKWLYYPEIEPGKRPKPAVIQNIACLRRKEKSIYKPSDIWTVEDDFLFLRYCPNKRDRCYHAVSRDTSCRPSEILKLRIKDIVFKKAIGNIQYAEVLVNGKTGSRHIPLIKSIPYVKDWLDDHPQKGNLNAPLICGFGKSLGRRILPLAVNRAYANYKTTYFTKLLDSNIPIEDKQRIKELLGKPWNPYIRRHSALTEKSALLKEHVLRQHAGWSINSNMAQKYIHYFGNESNESILEAYGVVTKDQKLSDVLKSKQCPNCSEPNKPDSKFCAKCRMVLTYDAYSETVEDMQIKDNEVKNLKEQMAAMQESQKEILDLLRDPIKLAEAVKAN